MPQAFNVGSRSLLVTSTAWVFLVLGASASLSTLLQNATLVSWLPGLQGLGAAQPLPLLTGLLIGYLPWVVGAGLALLLATMASAAGLWLQHEVVQSLVEATLARAPLPAAAADVFGGFVTASQVMAALVTLAACALLGWIMRRLMSATVRLEFS